MHATSFETTYCYNGKRFGLFGFYAGYGYRLVITDESIDYVDIADATIWKKFFHSTDVDYAFNYMRKVCRNLAA